MLGFRRRRKRVACSLRLAGPFDSPRIRTPSPAVNHAGQKDRTLATAPGAVKRFPLVLTGSANSFTIAARGPPGFQQWRPLRAATGVAIAATGDRRDPYPVRAGACAGRGAAGDL